MSLSCLTYTAPMFRQKSKFIFLFLLLGLSLAAHAEKADRDKPINIVSDKLNVDDASRVSTFEGKVELIQGTLHLLADKLVVTEDAVGNKHCVATGKPANFRQKREKTNEYVEGYGDRIEYDSLAGTVDFFTHARVKREQDDVRGDHITYNTQTEIFRVSGSPNSGRVHATILPKSKQPAPAQDQVSSPHAASDVAPANPPVIQP